MVKKKSKMEIAELLKLGELPITLAIVVIFLVYMYKKNGKTERVLNRVGDALDGNSNAIERNTKVLARHLMYSKGNEDDINKLMDLDR